MKILVFDDNETHRNAARAQLKDHDLTVVGTYDEAQDLLMSPRGFDAVLVDLLVPASAQMLGKKHPLTGQEMPVGIFIGLLAAVMGGVKHVAVFTDSDHHSHPASACFDCLNEDVQHPTHFSVAGAQVILVNNPNWVVPFYKDDLSRQMPWRECSADRKRDEPLAVAAKNWKRLLEYLLDPMSKEEEE